LYKKKMLMGVAYIPVPPPSKIENDTTVQFLRGGDRNICNTLYYSLFFRRIKYII